MKSTFLSVSSLLLIFMTALGCSTSPDSRIAANQAQFDSWPQEVQEHVAVGAVDLGYSPDMVRMAMGDPDRITTRLSGTGESVVWVYEADQPVNVSFGIGMGTSTGRHSGVSSGVVLSPNHVKAGEAARIIFVEGVVGSIEQSE